MDLKDKEHLGENAEDYWYYAGKKDLVKRILDNLGIRKKSDILVVGCGVGEDLNLISNYGKVTALDSDGEALKHVPETYSKVKTKIEDIAFNEEYDLILMFDVLEHIKDDSLALNKIYNSLRIGGTFVIGVPAYRILFGPHDINTGHYRRYNSRGIKKMLENAGFKDIRLSYWNSLLCPFVFLQKITQKVIHGDKPKTGLTKLPKLVNDLLILILKTENKIRGYIIFPFGITIIGVTRKG